MAKNQKALHPALCETLQVAEDTPAAEALAAWSKRTRSVCKPCWELKYCPYGPLVEGFPLVPPTTSEIAEWMEDAKKELAEARPGSHLAASRKHILRRIRWYKTGNFPESIPRDVAAAACTVFGHICPVFFVGSGFTETKEGRRQTRSISRDTMLKVIRRDGQICQACHKPVPDNEVEFDHVIPFARGGTTTAQNLRLVHRNCNRSKGASLKDLLEDPEALLREIQEQAAMKTK